MTINAIFGRELMLDRNPIAVTSKMERLEGYGQVLASSVDFQEGDVLILHSVSGRNPVTIDLAFAARKVGVQINNTPAQQLVVIVQENVCLK